MVKRTVDNIEIADNESTMLSITGLMTTATLNAKPTEIENKIPDITNLAFKAPLNKNVTQLESKIPEITYLAIKATLNTKATNIENKMSSTISFITFLEFSRLKKLSFHAKMKESAKNLAIKGQGGAVIDKTDKNRAKIKRNFK